MLHFLPFCSVILTFIILWQIIVMLMHRTAEAFLEIQLTCNVERLRVSVENNLDWDKCWRSRGITANCLCTLIWMMKHKLQKNKLYFKTTYEFEPTFRVHAFKLNRKQIHDRRVLEKTQQSISVHEKQCFYITASWSSLYWFSFSQNVK